jgi:hypothetical protein
METTNNNFTEAFEKYLDDIRQAKQNEWQRNGYTLPVPTFDVIEGKTYYKIIRTDWGQTSLHCFVDGEGNIYKAATYKAPAKGIRGNIFNEKRPLLGHDFYR